MAVAFGVELSSIVLKMYRVIRSVSLLSTNET